MMETYWAIQRRDNGRIMVHTISWLREGAWAEFCVNWPNTTRRKLRKQFVATKIHVVLALAP